MKQLTQNPAADSIAKGWQMMCMCVSTPLGSVFGIGSLSCYCMVTLTLSKPPSSRCVSTFPPSTEFENYVLNFLLAQLLKRGAVKNYARYCLRTLEGMLESGASGFVPSVEEIQSYKERPPILATISLVDGMVLTEEPPVTPDLNAGKVAEICAQFLELVDEVAAVAAVAAVGTGRGAGTGRVASVAVRRMSMGESQSKGRRRDGRTRFVYYAIYNFEQRMDTMGIFVYDEPRDESYAGVPDPDAEKPYADLVRTPRPLRAEDYMGDVIVQKARQKRPFKFVFKRKIFLPSQNGPSEDEMFSRLTYLQAEDELINKVRRAVLC